MWQRKRSVRSCGIGGPWFLGALLLLPTAGIAQFDLDPIWVSQESGNSCSVAWADFDGDGDPDLAVGVSGEPNRLYRNDGGGRFTEVAAREGVQNPQGRDMGVSFCDYDGDGDADLFVCDDEGGNSLFRNEGDGPRQRFREVGLHAGVAYDLTGGTLGTMGAGQASALHILARISTAKGEQQNIKVDDLLIAGNTIRLRGTCPSFDHVFRWRDRFIEMPEFTEVHVQDPRKETDTNRVRFTMELLSEENSIL